MHKTFNHNSGNIEIYDSYCILNTMSEVLFEKVIQSTYLPFAKLKFIQLHKGSTKYSIPSSIEFILKDTFPLDYLSEYKIYFTSASSAQEAFKVLFNSYNLYLNLKSNNSR